MLLLPAQLSYLVVVEFSVPLIQAVVVVVCGRSRCNLSSLT